MGYTPANARWPFHSPRLPKRGASFWTTVAIATLVLVSGAARTWVGLAGLRQELAVAERRDRDDSERAAERVARSLELALGTWTAAVAAIRMRVRAQRRTRSNHRNDGPNRSDRPWPTDAPPRSMFAMLW
jgi:hypothetical protein